MNNLMLSIKTINGIRIGGVPKGTVAINDTPGIVHQAYTVNVTQNERQSPKVNLINLVGVNT